MIPIERQELTIRRTPLYIIAAVFILLLYILHDTGKIDGAAYFATGGLLLFFVLYRMLLKNKFIVDNDGITQELFFRKTKEMKWHEIVSSGLNWQYHGHGANLSWNFFDRSGKKISIQAAMYSRNKLRIIATALVEKNQQACIDKRIIKMAEGRFPWFMF